MPTRATDVFFDTNVLLYLLSADEAKSGRAEALLAAGGTVSVQVLNEFAAVGSRMLRLAVPDIREILGTVRAICSVRALDLRTHELALDLAERHRLDIYDALIVAAAVQAECRVLYTEDLQDGRAFGGLVVCNPFAPI